MMNWLKPTLIISRISAAGRFSGLAVLVLLLAGVLFFSCKTAPAGPPAAGQTATETATAAATVTDAGTEPAEARAESDDRPGARVEAAPGITEVPEVPAAPEAPEAAEDPGEITAGDAPEPPEAEFTAVPAPESGDLSARDGPPKALAFAHEVFVEDPAPPAPPAQTAARESAGSPPQGSPISPASPPEIPSPAGSQFPGETASAGAGEATPIRGSADLFRRWEVQASRRDSRELILEGGGWTLVNDDGGVEFRVTRIPSSDQTRFVFLFPREGQGQLDFFRQDHYQGIQTRLALDVTVTPEEPAPAGTAFGTAPAEIPAMRIPSDGPAQTSGAAGFEPGGSSEQPPAEPGGTSPSGETPPAEVLPDGAAIEKALDENNRDFFAGRGGEELLDRLTRAGGQDGGLPEGITPALLFRMFDFLVQQGLDDAAEKTGAWLSLLDLPEHLKDRYYIRLGRFYENSPKYRDERKALEYYSRLVEECPASVYWDEANRQSRFLQRHYFRIY